MFELPYKGYNYCPKVTLQLSDIDEISDDISQNTETLELFILYIENGLLVSVSVIVFCYPFGAVIQHLLMHHHACNTPSCYHRESWLLLCRF